MTKKLFMQFVLAVITLASTQAHDHATLEAAQKQAKDAADQLQALKDADAASAEENKLSDEENQQIQQALNLISAAAPPSPEQVNSIAANVEQTTAAPVASEQPEPIRTGAL